MGGPATATANATAGTGGAGSFYYPVPGFNGLASAESTARSANGASSAQSTAQSGSLSVTTTAHAPAGGPSSALTKVNHDAHGAGVLIPIEAGQAASFATYGATPHVLAVGAMSAGYGGTGESLTYTAEADFGFVSPGFWDYAVILNEYSYTGAGFDDLEFQVKLDGNNWHTFNTDSLSAAEAFFTNNTIDLGYLAPESQTIDLISTFTASEVGAGFGFNYTVVPEASTWAMMLTGFMGLGFAGWRRARVAPGPSA
jgi:hypothetical protein